MSHPSRVRGLKRVEGKEGVTTIKVAPLAGAWIETNYIALRMWKRNVAPLAGAWIETATNGIVYLVEMGRTPRGCVD